MKFIPDKMAFKIFGVSAEGDFFEKKLRNNFEQKLYLSMFPKKSTS